MTKLNLLFALERETKGAVRYMEVDEQGNQVPFPEKAAIGTIYIRKTAFKGNPIPTKLDVEITGS